MMSADKYTLSPLYDFSLDIERHKKDLQFTSTRGTIDYIFDQNIFELFLHPYENTNNASANWLSPLWLKYSGSKFYKFKKSSAQNTLLASEILFGGNLPGQVHEKIFLSEWHRSELNDRMGFIIASFGQKNLSAFKKDAKNLLSQKFLLWQENKLDADFHLKSSFKDPYLKHDIKILKKHHSFDNSLLNSFSRTREVALALATDKSVEPAQQLMRLLERDFQDRLFDAKTIRPPKFKRELDFLKKTASKYDRAIKEEIAIQKLNNAKRVDRPNGSIWNDARTLALVELLSQKLPPKKRVVFVTGDKTVYDAYRRCYEKERRNLDLRQPFIIRRVSQYTQLFNQTLENRAAKEQRKYFESVRQGVQLALLPIKLSAVTGEYHDSEILYNRESLTVPTADDNILESYWKKHYSEKVGSRLKKLEDECRFTERMTVGLSRHLLMNRMSDSEIELFERLATWSENQDKLLDDYIQKTVKTLNVSALSLAQPEALDFLRKVAENGVQSNVRKVPLALNLPVSKSGILFDLKQFLESSIQDAADPSTFLSNAFDIFVASSAVALMNNQWAVADQFSDLAISSSIYMDGDQRVTEARAAEAYYLSALANRFLLGETYFAKSGYGSQAAKELFGKASKALKRSEVLARNVQKKNAGDSNQSFLSYRFNSELAALNLFASLCFYKLSEIVDDTTQSNNFHETAQKYHSSAKVCLQECVRVEKYADKGLFSLDTHIDSIALVKSQVLINIADYFVLSSLLNNKEEFERDVLSNECIKHLAHLEMMFAKQPERLFEAEILVFKILLDIEKDESSKRLQKLGTLAASKSTLPLDHFLLSKIFECWG